MINDIGGAASLFDGFSHKSFHGFLFTLNHRLSQQIDRIGHSTSSFYRLLRCLGGKPFTVIKPLRVVPQESLGGGNGLVHHRIQRIQNGHVHACRRRHREKLRVHQVTAGQSMRHVA